MNERTFDARQVQKLEDPERLVWLPPDEAVRLLGLAPGMTIADVGAGTGFFAIPFARAVAPSGSVWAVDMQPELLQRLGEKLDCIPNVHLLEGTAVSTGVASGTCDLVFYANVWHELDDRAAVLAEARRMLRSSGRIAILDWRPDYTPPPGPPQSHRVSMETVAAELKANGWQVVYSGPFGARSYLVTGSALPAA